MAEHFLSAAEVAAIRDGVDYARIALNGWKDGQWERVPAGWTLAAWVTQVDTALAQDARWRALVGECLNTMRRLEWSSGWRNRHGVDYRVCPACQSLSWNSHNTDCWLAAALNAVQAALDGTS